VPIRRFVSIDIGRRGSRTLSVRNFKPLTTCPGRELVTWYLCWMFNFKPWLFWARFEFRVRWRRGSTFMVPMLRKLKRIRARKYIGRALSHSVSSVGIAVQTVILTYMHRGKGFTDNFGTIGVTLYSQRHRGDHVRPVNLIPFRQRHPEGCRMLRNNSRKSPTRA